MDEIETRLKEATDQCLATHEAWRKDQKNTKAREDLMDAVHELRKIAARLEIDIAVSERDEMASKPIPIPPHRAKRKGNNNGNDDNKDNNKGNNDGGGNKGNGGGGGSKGRGRGRRKSSGGDDN